MFQEGSLFTNIYHIVTILFSRNKSIPKINPDHFWHFGPDPDQVRNSGPYWSHCKWNNQAAQSTTHLARRFHSLYKTGKANDPGKREATDQPPVHASQLVEAGLLLHQEHVVFEVLLRGGDCEPDCLDVNRTPGLLESAAFATLVISSPGWKSCNVSS